MRNLPEAVLKSQAVRHASAFQARRSRREAIKLFFLDHLGERFGTMTLHERFGTSFRARASEINRDSASPVKILNATSAAEDTHGQLCERSVYWGELRVPVERIETEFMRQRREDDAAAMPLFAGVRS